ncbi:hypothetical protein TNCT_264751 [Trichonephila clavata]|uniref:Uncharacterized protein n=1 Tax=Trichonephila clavata TaxID=2740835 RepID=A0A8X6GGS4_TRICU|nr:hypothetical protein TNCT_264751 [Trichonephila clavata]
MILLPLWEGIFKVLNGPLLPSDQNMTKLFSKINLDTSVKLIECHQSLVLSIQKSTTGELEESKPKLWATPSSEDNSPHSAVMPMRLTFCFHA